MTRPEGGEGDDEGNAKESTKEGFDDVWGALVDSASAETDARGATKAWTEDVRAELKRGPAEEAEPEAPAGPSATKVWTEEARAERKRDAPPSASSSSSALLGPDPEKLRAAADDEMERLMKAEPESVMPKPAEVVEVRPAAPREEKPARAMEEVRDRVRPVVEEHAFEVEREPEIEHAPPKRTGLWIAGIAAVLVVGWVAFGRGDAAPEETPVGATTAKSEIEAKRSTKRDGALASAQGRDEPEQTDDEHEPPPTKTVAAPVETDDEAEVDVPEKQDDPTPPVKPATEAGAEEDEEDEQDQEDEEDEEDEAAPTAARANGRVVEMKRDGDPREVPPGTAPANAAAFLKLPVGPGDRAPLGGVGRNGVHVDRIATGSTVDKARCTGEGEQFSASRHDVVNVCVRVVHARQKEDLVVLWQKDGGTVRRGKFVVPAVHAYRTRAYLVMRKEYVGKWTVRIQDLDGTELASHPFVVVE